jgi:hypothetical protein
VPVEGLVLTRTDRQHEVRALLALFTHGKSLSEKLRHAGSRRAKRGEVKDGALHARQPLFDAGLLITCLLLALACSASGLATTGNVVSGRAGACQFPAACGLGVADHAG